MKAKENKPNIVYIIGAGFSTGLGFPTIKNLLPNMWDRLREKNISHDLAKIIRFHHPAFHSCLHSTYPNIEQLLSEMHANEQLFTHSRPATGNFSSEELVGHRQSLLLELARWFHDLKNNAFKSPSDWLNKLIEKMKIENAQVISFNWDLVLDELLFGDDLDISCYGFGKPKNGVRLIKPHGSLNWYEAKYGNPIKKEMRFSLHGKGNDEIFMFRRFREPISSKERVYMPLIVPPTYAKEFNRDLFQHLWQETVSAISTATEVRFLGYSLADADFHARFILRCGFHNQEEGVLLSDGNRAPETGRSKVTIVDLSNDTRKRISEVVGWDCDFHNKSIEEWATNL